MRTSAGCGGPAGRPRAGLLASVLCGGGADDAAAAAQMVKDKKVDVIARDYTINLHKALHGIGFKRRAPRAVVAIKKFAEKQMGTSDVRIDQGLNKAVWSNGVKAVARRIRVRIARKRNDDEDAVEEFFTLVTHVPVAPGQYKGLETQVAEDE